MTSLPSPAAAWRWGRQLLDIGEAAPRRVGHWSLWKLTSAPRGPMSILAMPAWRQLMLDLDQREQVLRSASGSGPKRSIISAAKASISALSVELVDAAIERHPHGRGRARSRPGS